MDKETRLALLKAEARSLAKQYIPALLWDGLWDLPQRDAAARPIFDALLKARTEGMQDG